MSILAEWSEASLKSLKKNPKYYYCKYFPDLTPSPELSYILGVRYGDLMVRSSGESLLRVKDRDFTEEFARCAEVIMGREYEVKPFDEGKRFRVQVNSKILSDFLKLSLEDHKKWVQPDYPAEFIRGFLDSDGSASENPRVTGHNTDKDVLYYVSRLLEKYFDISSNVITLPSSVKRVGKIRGYIDGRPITTRKVLHTLYITGLDNVEEFFWEVRFSIARKMEILERGLYVDLHPNWEALKLWREERGRL